MNHLTTTLLFLFFSLSVITAQTSIGGIINDYAKVNHIENSDDCNPYITVDEASPFQIGDYLMIIQMKGAEIDTSNTATFGTITALNSAGLFEKTMISDIIGNDIYLSHQIVNDYDINGSVQIVSIPQYTNATVDTKIEPAPWNGEKGGVVALEVAETLTLNEGIVANFAGFRGGVSDNQSSNCNWFTSHELYHYPDNSPLGDAKGEGIANFYANKENGRGPQANGGGGGNDHNAGGGGGSNIGDGGLGGQNLNPNPLQCSGQFPGIGGKSLSNLENRLFLGGGGGSGHANDGNGSESGNGGGIIYLKAHTVIGNWKSIAANGKLASMSIGADGASGGGAGGSILANIDNFNYGLRLDALGGHGGDINMLGNNGCMGPGGGGGGGIVYSDLVTTNTGTLYSLTTGGEAGIITNTPSSCAGESSGATNGLGGQKLSGFEIPIGDIIIHMVIDTDPSNSTICNNESTQFSIQTNIAADNYQWQINNGNDFTPLSDDANYSGTNTNNLNIANIPSGIYEIQCLVNGGCNDSHISGTAILEVLSPANITVQPVDTDICQGESFTFQVEASEDNAAYQWQVNEGNGFMNITDNNIYGGTNSHTLTIVANQDMEGYLYQCIVNNNCPGTDISNAVSVSINPLPIPDFTFYVINDSLFVQNNSTNFDDYYWDFGTSEPLEPGGVPYYIYEENGSYFVTIYAINDCGTTTMTYPVEINHTSVNIQEMNTESINFTISPNPTSGKIRIDIPSNHSELTQINLYHINGQLLKQTSVQDNFFALDLEQYPSGTYLIQVIIDHETSTQKVVKE